MNSKLLDALRETRKSAEDLGLPLFINGLVSSRLVGEGRLEVGRNEAGRVTQTPAGTGASYLNFLGRGSVDDGASKLIDLFARQSLAELQTTVG